MCADYYHAILAEEQADPEMYRWHAPVVCAYLLQHPSQAHAKYLDGQFRQLQLLLDRGLEAMLRVAAHQVARNRARTGYDMAPLEAYEALPEGGPPGRFGASFSGLPVRAGSFVADGHQAYGRSVEAVVGATVRAWLDLPR